MATGVQQTPFVKQLASSGTLYVFALDAVFVVTSLLFEFLCVGCRYLIYGAFGAEFAAIYLGTYVEDDMLPGNLSALAV